MKLARFDHQGRTHWGIVDVAAASVRPVEGTILDWGAKVTAGDHEAVRPAGPALALADVRLLAPVEPTSEIIGVGLNYPAHLEGAGVKPFPTTQGFIKTQAAVIGPNDDIAYPALTEKLDYEVELVVVAGADVPAGSPLLAVLGYTVGNDTSARDAVSPFGGPDLFSMKSLGGSSPLGPWIVTADELGGAVNPDVELKLTVNGELRQRDRTGRMIWPVDELLEYVVARTPLTTGDILWTGTPAGTAMETGRYLELGDVVECEIERIGRLRNVIGPRA